MSEKITVQTIVQAPLELVWRAWTEPEYITKWNAASPDWHTPQASNDLRVGGEYHSRMEARDGSAGFDFWGTYTEVAPHTKIASTMGDGRRLEVSFAQGSEGIQVTEVFEAEETNSLEMQRNGWQSILNEFKKYVEGING